MSAHTPGPWTTDEGQHDVPDQNICIVHGLNHICEVWMDDAPSPEFNREQRANARLIAAAPDLLAALQAVIDDPSDAGMGINVYRLVQEAIAKATGSQCATKPSLPPMPSKDTLEITMRIGEFKTVKEIQFIRHFTAPAFAVEKTCSEMWVELARATGAAS